MSQRYQTGWLSGPDFMSLTFRLPNWFPFDASVGCDQRGLVPKPIFLRSRVRCNRRQLPNHLTAFGVFDRSART